MVSAEYRGTRTNCWITSPSWKATGRIACSQCSATGSGDPKAPRWISPARGKFIRVFTTRIDTIYGATCLIVAPEHPLVSQLDETLQARAKAMIDARAGQGPGDIEKEGFPTGLSAR